MKYILHNRGEIGQICILSSYSLQRVYDLFHPAFVEDKQPAYAIVDNNNQGCHRQKTAEGFIR
jgi:hypothetical protein